MGKAMDVERDMVRATEALQVVLDFLRQYDHAHAVLNGNGKGNGLSPLTLRVDDGLRAANRVLVYLRGAPDPSAPAPAGAVRDSPVPRPPAPRHGDRVEGAPRRPAHGDPGE